MLLIYLLYFISLLLFLFLLSLPPKLNSIFYSILFPWPYVKPISPVCLPALFQLLPHLNLFLLCLFPTLQYCYSLLYICSFSRFIHRARHILLNFANRAHWLYSLMKQPTGGKTCGWEPWHTSLLVLVILGYEWMWLSTEFISDAGTCSVSTASLPSLIFVRTSVRTKCLQHRQTSVVSLIETLGMRCTLYKLWRFTPGSPASTFIPETVHALHGLMVIPLRYHSIAPDSWTVYVMSAGFLVSPLVGLRLRFDTLDASDTQKTRLI